MPTAADYTTLSCEIREVVFDQILSRFKTEGTTRSGGALRRTHFQFNEFKPILLCAGLPTIRFHDLRHTSATLLLSAGAHPKIVQERLGHSQISVTLDTYSHVLPSMQHEAAAKIDEMLAPKSDAPPLKNKAKSRATAGRKRVTKAAEAPKIRVVG